MVKEKELTTIGLMRAPGFTAKVTDSASATGGLDELMVVCGITVCSMAEAFSVGRIPSLTKVSFTRGKLMGRGRGGFL